MILMPPLWKHTTRLQNGYMPLGLITSFGTTRTHVAEVKELTQELPRELQT